MEGEVVGSRHTTCVNLQDARHVKNILYLFSTCIVSAFLLISEVLIPLFRVSLVPPDCLSCDHNALNEVFKS